MHDINCPVCKFHAAAFEKIDEQGAHYICPGCDHEWTDPKVTLNDYAIDAYADLQLEKTAGE